jgi:hypothetical protein
MLKAIYAVFASAFVAGSFLVALSISEEVEARGSKAKSDRIDARPLANACSAHAWPYFETTCLRDQRNPLGRAVNVRLASLDNLASAKGRDVPAVAPRKNAPAKARDATRRAADRRADARTKARPIR